MQVLEISKPTDPFLDFKVIGRPMEGGRRGFTEKRAGGN
jgi:hypothetical protein